MIPCMCKGNENEVTSTAVVPQGTEGVTGHCTFVHANFFHFLDNI